MADQYPTMDITSDDKLWGLLSYLLSPIVPIIVLLMEDKKARPFIKYHAVQALAWGVVWLVAYILVIGVCISPLWLIGTIWFAIKAYQGEYLTIPVLTDFVKGQGWV